MARAQLNNNAVQLASIGAGLASKLLPAGAALNATNDVRLTATRRQVLTVMFVDIRGSSKIEESLSPQLTVEFLNIYLGLAAQAILAHNGGVNQFIGDGVLATFGLRGEPDHGAANAIAAADAIHRAFESAKDPSGSGQQVRALVAIHTGTAIVHSVGRAEQSHYGVLGAAVNVASRLEREGKELGLQTVMSGSTVAVLKNGPGSVHLVVRKKLRGISDRVEIWSPDSMACEESVNSTEPAKLPAGDSRAGALDWRPLARGIFVAGTFIASLIPLFWLRPEGHFTGALMSTAQVMAALLATLTCASTARRSDGRVRKGWALIAASAAVWALGQTQAGLLGSGLGKLSLGALTADTSFLGSLTLATAGVLCFWNSSLRPYDRLRAVIDGLIVSTSLAFALLVISFDQVGASLPTRFVQLSDQIAFGTGEIVLGTAVILVINRGARHLQAPLLIMLMSVAVGATAAAFGALETRVFDTGVFVADASLLLALLLLALAPLWPVGAPLRTPEGSVDAWEVALPWLAVLLATSCGIWRVVNGHGLDAFLTLLSAVVVGLLAASQFLARRDSLRLLGRTARSERTLADVIARAPIGIARVDAELRVITANPAFSVLVGEPLEAIASSAITKYVAAEIQPRLRSGFRALGTGTTDIFESGIPMVRPDGNRGWLHMTTTAVRKSAGELDYFVVMMQDTTAQHETEEVSKTTLAELEHLNRLKTEFMQSISHEFKSALIGIAGFSELMRDSGDINVGEVRDFAREIRSGAERLNRMVAEFLDLNRAETSPARILVGSVDVNAVIRSALEQVKLGADGLTFNAVLDPHLPLMEGDEEKVERLVTLLLGNAVRYSPDGGQVTVATRTHVGQLEVVVTDQGVGTRADFDNPLFSGDDLYASNPIRKVIGTGLGLGIARQIVALHGGRIWMDRLDGLGSEAHVTFPLDMTARHDAAPLQPMAAIAS